MPAWTSYDQQPDGRYRFVDDQGGELYLLPSPSVDAVRAEIDARNAPPPPPAPAPAMQQPLAPAPMPDPIIAMQGPPQTMQLASDAPDPNAQGASGNAAPPAPEPAGAGGAPQAPPPSAQGQDQGQGGASQGPATGQPGQSTAPIVRTPGGGTPPVSASFWNKAAEEEAKGTPGVVINTPGGTFETGKTVQFAPGPDPGATRARERAEKNLANAQSDLIYVEARKQQEQAELAQAEAVRAQERQRQLQELQAREQEKLAPIFEEIDAKRQDLAASKLDPDKLINEMGSARQALLGVAMALGGFGKALAGEDGPPMAMQLWKEAVANDIANQKYAIEKKRADISTLGQVYQLAKERFNDERMAQEAAYLAGLEVYKAKLTRTVAEADAAMGVETQYNENGEIVAGAPYAMRAKAALAALAVEQAKIRESLSQQAAGQVAQQYVTTQDKTTVVGGKKPNWAKAAEYAEKAEKAGEGGAQQVTYGGQKFKLGSFVEQGEGKKLREDIGDIEATKREVAILEKELRENPVGSRTYDASRVKGLIERVTSKANVILGQGAKNNDEAKRWEAITMGVLTNGQGAVKDMHSWLDDMAKRKLDQVNATPASGGSSAPQSLRDLASGKTKPAGGVVVLPRQAAPGQAAAPSAPVVRASGAKASPLDRTGAALVQASTAGDDKVKTKAVELATKSLREALAAKQIGPGEYKVALQMAKDGQYDQLLDFLGRMRGTVSTTPQPITPEDQAALARSISAQVALGRVGLAPYQTQAGADKAMGVGAPVTTTISTKIGKPKGKGR